MDIPVFTTIKSFVNDLNELYGNKQRSLALYNRLLSKTQVSHSEYMEKHISIFKKFVVDNRTAIVGKDVDLMREHRVSYNERVYINVNSIIKMSDPEAKSVIWTHLLVLSAYLDPQSGAKGQLQKVKESKSVAPSMPPGIDMPTGPTGDFLGNIINKLQSSIDVKEDSNPMDVFNQIMSSGALNDVMGMVNGGMENGQFDMGQLMGMAQGMLSQMGGTGGEGGTPDIGSMMKQFGLDENALKALTEQVQTKIPETEE